MRTITCTVLLCLTLAVGASLSNAGTIWGLQGVIDWDADAFTDYSKCKAVTDIYAENGLNAASGTLPQTALKDGVFLVPRADEIDAQVDIRTLTGAAPLLISSPIDPDYIDYYEIYAWEDVNNNGEADEDDKIDGTEQNWTCILHTYGAPSEEYEGQDAAEPASREAYEPQYYDTTTGEAKISDLVKPRSSPTSGVLPLRSGKSYLLLLRVHATIPSGPGHDGDSGTNLQFTGGVTPSMRTGWGDSVTVSTTTKEPEEGWSATEAPLKYLSSEGNSSGVDDFEVLWVRVNNPPALPVVP